MNQGYIPIEVKEFQDWYIANQHPQPRLFKGISSNGLLGEVLRSETKKHIRASSTAKINGNSYNLLLNNLNSWNTLPRREKSIICSTSRSSAEHYAKLPGFVNGQTYCVFPISLQSHIALAPKSDILYCFDRALKKLNIPQTTSLVFLNQFLVELAKKYNLTASFDISWETLLSFIEKLEEQKVSELIAVLGQNSNVVNLFDSILNPFDNGFKKITWFELECTCLSGCEAWLEDDCFLVEYNLFHNAVKQVT